MRDRAGGRARVWRVRRHSHETTGTTMSTRRVRVGAARVLRTGGGHVPAGCSYRRARRVALVKTARPHDKNLLDVGVGGRAHPWSSGKVASRTRRTIIWGCSLGSGVPVMSQASLLRKCFQIALACLFLVVFSQVDAASAGTQPAPPTDPTHADDPPPTHAPSVDGARVDDPAAVPTPPPPPTSRPADIVILVDGSLSTSPERANVFELEMAAAAAIAMSEPNPDSRVAVSVFGSRDAPRQEPTAEVCLADQVGNRDERGRLEGCLTRQTPRVEGEGADLPAAMRQALAILGEPDDGRDEIVFVLSDGVLRVDHSPSYPGNGENDEKRNWHAGMSLGLLLADDFGPRGIQVRPISFGKDDEPVPTLGLTGAQILETLAAGGGRGRCLAEVGVPRVAPGASPVEAVGAGLTSFAAARCLGIPVPVHPTGLPDGTADPDGTTEFDVPVPVWAETAALTVVGAEGAGGIGGVREFGVAYPDGHPFQENGDETVIDRLPNRELITLRVQRPVPGIWRVRALTTDRPIGAFVTWSSEPAAALLVHPARPDAHGVDTGQPRGTVDLHVRVFSRENAFRDDDLLGLAVEARVTGDGMKEIGVPLTGAVLDPKVGDVAEFTGTVVVPVEATGAVRFEALISAGPGTPTVSRVVHTFVLDPNWDKLPPVEVAPPNDGITVSPGGSAAFELAGTYGHKDSTTVGIRLRDMTVPGFRVGPEQIQLSGNHGRLPGVSLVVPGDAPPGRVHGVMEVFDPAHPEVILSMTPIDVEVAEASGGRHLLGTIVAVVMLAGLVLLILAAIVRAVLRRRRARVPTTEIHPVSGLCLWLERGNAFEDYLQARDDEGAELYFDIIDADTDTPRLARAAPGCYTGVLKGTSDPGQLEIDWSNGMEPDILRLDRKSKTTYGNLIVEVTGRRPVGTLPVAEDGVS